MTPWRFQGARCANPDNSGSFLRTAGGETGQEKRASKPRGAYFAGAGAGKAAAGAGAAAGGAAEVPVVGAGGWVAAAACGWAAGLIQHA